MIKIIIDRNIPSIEGAFEGVADVVYLPYKEMTPETVRDADALIVRTRTKCNRSLLEGSKVKFIASATIGYDHIDAAYCEENGIQWANAPGCNALSVAQYMASALCVLKSNYNFDFKDKTIGIVGVGAVGSKIELLAKAFGMNVLLNDPPRQRREGDLNFVSLNEIAEKADIITFHTPLNRDGIDRTFHLADEQFFASLRRKPVIINAARGEVVDTEALKKAMNDGLVAEAIVDCWENEPNIDRDLLKMSLITTPHIAGYSADGKANAARQSVQAVSRFFHLGKDDWQPNPLPKGLERDFKNVNTCDFFTQSYNILEDSERLKTSPETFENQRSNYPFRREPKAYIGHLPNGFEEKFDFFFHE